MTRSIINNYMSWINENRKKVILKITFWRNVYIENIKEFMEEIDIVFY